MPAVRKLYPFQEDGVRFLSRRQACLLSDEMGTGKTWQALNAAYGLPGEPRPVVIVSPAAVKSVWTEEAKLLNQEKRWKSVDSLSGRSSFRWPEPGEVLVTSYEILPEPPPEAPVDKRGNVLCAPAPALCWACKGIGCPQCQRTGKRPESAAKTVLVLDEAHKVKNHKTRAWKACRALAESVLAGGGRVWLVTATPLLNRPSELKDVLAVADLDKVLFSCFEEFLMAFNGRYETVWVGKRRISTIAFDKEPVAAPWVKERLDKICIRRTRKEVLPDLPPKTVQDIHVESDTTYPLLKKLAEQLEKKEWDGRAETLEKTSVGEISKTRGEIAKRKLAYALALVEEAEEAEEPIVVFSAHQAPIEGFRSREGWRVITGQTSQDERTEIVAAFQAGKLKGVALTIIAGGVGITLTHGCQAIFIDLSWTPSLNSQAEDRLSRIGQKRPVFIRRIVIDHPLEKRLYEILSRKSNLIDSIWENESTPVSESCVNSET